MLSYWEKTQSSSGLCTTERGWRGRDRELYLCRSGLLAAQGWGFPGSTGGLPVSPPVLSPSAPASCSLTTPCCSDITFSQSSQHQTTASAIQNTTFTIIHYGCVSQYIKPTESTEWRLNDGWKCYANSVARVTLAVVPTLLYMWNTASLIITWLLLTTHYRPGPVALGFV